MSKMTNRASRSNRYVDNVDVGGYVDNVVEIGSTSHQETQNDNGWSNPTYNGNNNQRIVAENPNLSKSGTHILLVNPK